jgi:hypothetical protein
MAHETLAEIAALLGGSGAAALLLAARRALLVYGLLLVATAEALLALALVPASDLGRLRAPGHLGIVALAAFGVLAVALLLARFPALTPLAVLLAAPFRLPVDLGSQHAFLLLPLYGVLAAASLALLARALRGRPLLRIPRLVALPAAAYIAFAALSLLWARDPEQGSIQLLFFLFPFAALVAAVARAPVASWLPRALALTVVALACLFAAIGLYQAWTRTLLFVQDLRVANAYTSYFRVTSLFKDPSIYGRHLVLATAVLLVLLWLKRLHVSLAAPLIGLIFLGLYFSYSQSSMVVLFAISVLVTLALGDRRSRRLVLLAALVAAVAGGAVAVTTAQEASIREATSGRSRLVSITTTVIANHPLLGVGIGSQPRASREETGRRSTAKSASHTTPLTVAAELGLVGAALYLAFLAGAARLLLLLQRRHRAFALGLGASFLVLLLHSLFYSGFFEDPITWGTLAVAAAALAAPATPPGARHEEPTASASGRSFRLPALAGADAGPGPVPGRVSEGG